MSRRFDLFIFALKQSFLALVTVLVCVFLLEWGLSRNASSKLIQSLERPEPSYSYAFKTNFGDSVGKDGLLSLAMHPLVGYINLPNQQQAYFSTDENGFRGSQNARLAGQTKTVVLVGGSAAFGTGLHRDEDTFASLLEASMEDVNVVNAAVIGHLSGQELAYVVSELVDFQPDLIIAFDGINDVIDQMIGWPRTVHTAGVNNTFFVTEERLRQLHALETGNLFSRFGAALPRVFKNIARHTPSSWSEIRPQSEGYSVVGQEIAKDPLLIAATYANNMEKMNIIGGAYGAKVLCALQPERLSFAPGAKQDMLANDYEIFRIQATKLLDESGVVNIDINDFTDALELRMFMDRMHLDARGNIKLAEILEATIQEKNLLSEG